MFQPGYCVYFDKIFAMREFSLNAVLQVEPNLSYLEWGYWNDLGIDEPATDTRIFDPLFTDYNGPRVKSLDNGCPERTWDGNG